MMTSIPTHWQTLLVPPRGAIGVIYGGDSAERDISLMSGEQVLYYLQKAGVDAFGIDLHGPHAKGQDIIQQIQATPMQAAFVILHGKGGEDGTIQAVLETLNIPYTGSGVMASSLAMHKHMTKLIWKACSITTPEWMVLTSEADCDQAVNTLGLPLLVKPMQEGSSIGVNIVKNREDMYHAFADAQKYDHQLMAETYIEGDEYTVGILEGRALPAIRLQTSHSFYDKEAKYFAEDTEYHFDNDLPYTEQIDMAKQCEQAFKVLGCCDWGRVDLIRNHQGQYMMLEINTLPGMTSHSLVPMAAKQIGLDFGQLIILLINLSLLRHNQTIVTQPLTAGTI